MDIARNPDTTFRGRLRRPSTMFLIVVAGLIGLMAIAALTVSLSAGGRLDPPRDTPAGAFQGYLRAYQAGDLEVAYGSFSSRVTRRLTFDSFEASATGWAIDDLGRERIVLDRVDEHPTAATLHLRVGRAGDRGLFDSGGDEWDMTVRLVLEDGTWRIDEPLAGIQATYQD